MSLKRLARKQIAEKIEELRPFVLRSRGVGSWVEYIRKAYGMTVRQLAAKSNISKSSIGQIEQREKEGQVTLRSLKQAAEALNCDFVYALVPRRNIEEVLREQALKKAKSIISESHLHMEIEDQALGQRKLQQQIEALADELIDSKKLWDEM